MEFAVCYPAATVPQPRGLAQYASYCRPSAAESTRHGKGEIVAHSRALKLHLTNGGPPPHLCQHTCDKAEAARLRMGVVECSPR